MKQGAGATTRDHRAKRLFAGLSAMVLTFSASVVTAPPASADVIVTDGCSFAPDSSSVPVYFNFHTACDNHDLCYGRHPYGPGPRGRLTCDQMFLRETSAWCNARYRYNIAGRLLCNGVALTYYSAVRIFGAPFFDNQQLT